MASSFHLVHFILLLLTAIFEVVALWFLIQIQSSHCVLGEEYGISVWLYLFFLPAITLQSVLLALFRVCFVTVGLDPIAMLFNLASGVVGTGTALTLLLTTTMHCGNEFGYMFYISSIFGFVAGILHLINACLCNSFMPRSEWFFAKPSKKQRMIAEQYRTRARMQVD